MEKSKFTTLEELKEYLTDRGLEGTVVFESPSYVSAVIGVSTDDRVVYDFELMVQELMDNDGMEYEEAVEFIEYNTIRAIPYAGSLAPIVMYSIDE